MAHSHLFSTRNALARSNPGLAASLSQQHTLVSNLKAKRKEKSLPSHPSNSSSAADFYVPSLPGQPPDSTLILYAGHLSFSPVDANPPPPPAQDSFGFFFLNKARHIAQRPILIIWLNGGPGCSSFDGGLMEVGPLRMVLNTQDKLREADAAWNEYANLLFIDQPTGTGYSYGPDNDFVHDLDTSTDHLLNLLIRFYRIFPEYSNMDLYIAGESFAGQFIPYFARAILDSNAIKAPLKGIMIGNGWIDPASQYMAYADFAFQVGLLRPNTATAEQVMREVNKCNETLTRVKEKKESITPHIRSCEGILSMIIDSTIQTFNSQRMCLNMYDVRLVDTYPACGMSWPPDLADMTRYLSNPDVKEALHAENHKGNWTECNTRVMSQFASKSSKPSIDLFPKLLDQIKILLFSGDQDLICCHLGTDRMVEKLTWGGQTGWTKAVQGGFQWNVNGTFAGTWREERNLTSVTLANGSHMAPYDVPYAAQDMLVRFLGLDLLTAAGQGARLSSRVGDGPEVLINRIKLNDSSILLAQSDLTGNRSLSPSSSISSSPESAAAGSSSKAQDEYDNLSSVGVFLILVLAVVGVTYFVRKGLRKNGSGDFGTVDDEGGDTSRSNRKDLGELKRHHPFGGNVRSGRLKGFGTDVRGVERVKFSRIPTRDQDDDPGEDEAN